MKSVRFAIAVLAVCMMASCGKNGKTPAYKDASLSIEKRVDDLLSRNMILGGTFDVTKLGKTELVLTQKVGTVTTVYSYKKQN